MYKVVHDFFSDHLVFAALLVSALWFYAGYQDLVKAKHFVGLSGQFIGVAVLGAFCVNAVLSRSWHSLIVALGAIAVELLLIRRYWREKHLGGI
jgi:hypothetical protein